MPLIPQYVSKEKLTTEPPAIKKSIELERQVGVGGFLKGAGELISDVAAKFNELRDINQVSDARIFVAQKQAELEDEIDKADIWTAAEELDNKIKKINDEAVAKINDPKAREIFRGQCNLHSIAFSQTIKDGIRKKQIDQSRVNIYRDLELEKGNYRYATTDAEKAVSATNMRNIIDAQVKLGVFTAEKGDALFDKTIKDAEEDIKDQKDLEVKERAEMQLAWEFAVNKREIELINMGLNKSASSEDLIRMAKEDAEAETPRIGAKFAQAFVNSQKSPKTVGAKTEAVTFNRLQDEFVALDIKVKTVRGTKRFSTKASFEDMARFRVNIIEAWGEGKITPSVAQNWLKAVSQVFDKALDKATEERLAEESPKTFWQKISFWSDEFAEDREETKARLGKDFMDRFLNTDENPEDIVDELIDKEQKNMNPNRTLYKLGETYNTPLGPAKVIGFDGDGEPLLDNEKIRELLK